MKGEKDKRIAELEAEVERLNRIISKRSGLTREEVGAILRENERLHELRVL